MNTIIETPKGYKKVEKEIEGNTVISFEPIEESVFPKNWEDFCRTVPLKKAEAYITERSYIWRRDLIKYRNINEDKHMFSSSQRAKAMLAFIQLIRVRDYVNGDWVADWGTDEYIFCIEYRHNEIGVIKSRWVSQPLHFKTAEIRDQFLTNFRGLIEEAKEFI